jgi:hypothetical protein
VISPSKHSHPDRTALYLASILLQYLRRVRVSAYAELLGVARKRVIGAEAIFLPALDLLYLLGLIEYRKKTDSFEFVGSNDEA